MVAPAPLLVTEPTPVVAVTLPSIPPPGQLPLFARGRRGDHGSFARVAVSATIAAPSSEPTIGDAGNQASSDSGLPGEDRPGEGGDARRKRRRRRRRGRRDGEPTTDAAPGSEPTGDDDDGEGEGDEPETTITAEPTPGASERNDAGPTDANDGDLGDRGRKRRRRRRNGRNLDARGPAPQAAAPAPERRPEPPVPVGVPVAVPRRMAQDEIIIDIDENELEVVQSEFGGMDDEFDEFALMDRRQAVIETLQEEVELEDVSSRDASRAAVEEEDEDDEDGSDEPETADTQPAAATANAEGESTETEAEADERKRKRRRRRKKPAPLVMPELTAPPHKDFWEVWAAKYTYQDFEDGKYTPPNDVPEVVDEPPPAPVFVDRSSSRAPRPAPVRTNGPRTSPPRNAPRPSGFDGPPPAHRAPVVVSASSEADDREFVKVCLSLGRSHGHKAATLRGLLRDQLGLEGRAIRDLTVRDVDTLFRVHQSEVARLQDVLAQVGGDTPMTLTPVEDHADALRAPAPELLAEALAALPTVTDDPAPADAPATSEPVADSASDT